MCVWLYVGRRARVGVWICWWMGVWVTEGRTSRYVLVYVYVSGGEFTSCVR